MKGEDNSVEEIIDIEEYFKQGKTPPKGKKYKIKVDRETFTVHQESMTGEQILTLAGKNPFKDYQLYKKVKGGGVEKVAYTEVVDFTVPGTERFTTQKLHHTDGEARKDFKLLEEDNDFLVASGMTWETVIENNLHYVILRRVNLPLGYNVDNADIAIRIETGYPRTQLDMAFFYPHLARTDGKSINNLTPFAIEGKSYQQWSRHRPPENPWIDGIDCLATHIGFAIHWLEHEFNK
ncbi:hypothetical protein BH10BAC4_BH10BAC4_05570 [soil metagenome]